MSNFKKAIEFSDRYIFNPFYFKLIMVIMTLLSAIPYIQAVIGGYVKYGLAFGVLICICTLFNGKFKEVLRNKYNLPLWIFVFLYAITTVINRDTLFTKNISQLVYMAIFFYLFVGVEGTLSPERRKKEMHVLFYIVLLFVAVFSSVGMYTFLLGISREYQLDIYYLSTHFGMYLGRLWGLYQPNTGGALAAVSLLITLYFLPLVKDKEKKASRVLLYIIFALNIILQFCYLVLTYSRGSIYAFIAAVAVYLFVAVYKLKALANKKIFVKVLASGVAAVILACGLYGFTGMTRSGLEYVPGIFQKVVGYESTEPSQTATVRIPVSASSLSVSKQDAPEVIQLEVEKTELDRADTSGDLTANGRTLIWKAALDSLKGHYVFGLTLEKAVKLTSDSLFSGLKECVDDGGMHNEYVGVLVSSGILGFIVLGGYMLLVLTRYIISIFSKNDLPNANLKVDFIVFCITVFFLVSGLVEMRILYRVGIFNVLFWICIGTLAARPGETYIDE